MVGMPRVLVSMGFFGDEGIELLLGDDAVLVKVSAFNHFLKDGVVG
jgi:hypothetical protein